MLQIYSIPANHCEASQMILVLISKLCSFTDYPQSVVKGSTNLEFATSGLTASHHRFNTFRKRTAFYMLKTYPVI